MEQGRLTPQRIATQCGVSPDTIRHYESVGVIPRAHRAPNGYRVFPEGTVARVQVVRRALAVGFSLHELADLFRERAKGAPPCRRAHALAVEKLAELDLRLAELAQLRTALRRIVADWEARLQGTAPGEPARLIDSLPDLKVRSRPLQPRKRKRT